MSSLFGKQKKIRFEGVKSDHPSNPINREIVDRFKVMLDSSKNTNIKNSNENSNNITDKFFKRLSTISGYENKIKAYNEVRDTIFSEDEPTCKIDIPKKVKIARERFAKRKEFRKAIESTCLEKQSDIRPYGSVEIFGKNIVGLIDTGANVSVLGKNAVEFLNETGTEIKSYNASVRTADGSSQSIIGRVRALVKFKDSEQPLDILIAPSLSQTLYLGSDFIRAFDLAPGLFPVEEALVAEDPNSHKLTVEQAKKLEEIIIKFPSFKQLGLGQTSILNHHIDTGDSLPIKQRHYPHSPAVQKEIEKALDQMLKDGIIQPSESSWNSPITAVIKPGKFRLCLDARKLNSVTKPFAYPLPIINGLLSRLGDTVFISSVDLKNAFWQIKLDDESREKTAFSVPNRPLYEFRVMPFGLSNAAQRLCQLMDRVIPAQYREKIFVYLDDLLIFSETFEEHLDLLTLVAERLKWANLTINVEKSKFCFKELRYLGYIVGNRQIKTDPEKVSAIHSFPVPKTLRQMRSFIGMASWYRRFIKNFSSIAAPLTDCVKTKKVSKFIVTEEAMRAFEEPKQCLMSAPVLINPNLDKEFLVICDASTYGVGAVLAQIDEEGEERAICYYSHKLNSAQKKYSITELECLAAVLSVKFFRPYIEGQPFRIITDHASLRWLMTQKDLTGRLARWSLKLTQFNFTIEHRKGSLQVVPDALSRCFVEAIETGKIIPIDLDSPAFESDEYKNIRNSVLLHNNSLPDLFAKEKFVFKKVKPNNVNVSEEYECWRLWVPESLTLEVIKQSHDLPNSSHGGYLKTLSKVRNFFYWPLMAKHIKEYVENCEECKLSKPPNYNTQPTMGKPFKVDRIFQHLYIDFMGPYPRTLQGHSYIFIMLDQLSKFPLIKTMSKATGSNVIKFLDEVFNIFGTPESVMSDNGSQFVGRQFQSFLGSYGIRHIKTGLYAPQSNASERVNRSIISSIRTYLSETDSHSKWNINLPNIMSALRSAVHSSIGTTPYQAVFGQQMIQHASLYRVLKDLNAVCDTEITVAHKIEKQATLREKIKSNLEKAYENAKKTYNTRGKVRNFKEGQEVLRRNFVLSNSSKKFNKKFAKKFQKCRVRKTVANNLYELEKPNGEYLGVYHAKDLMHS